MAHLDDDFGGKKKFAEHEEFYAWLSPRLEKARKMFEDFVTEKVHEGRSILGLYPATDPQTSVDFEAWRKANGR